MRWWTQQSLAAKWMDVYGVLTLACIPVALTVGVEERSWLTYSIGAGFTYCAGAAALIYLRQRGKSWLHGVWTFYTGFGGWLIVGAMQKKLPKPHVILSSKTLSVLFAVVVFGCIVHGAVRTYLL